MLSKPVYAETEGIVTAMDTRALGMAVVSLGGGRRKASDPIDYSVGLSDIAPINSVADGQMPLAMIHANNEDAWNEAAQAVRRQSHSVRAWLQVPADLPPDQRIRTILLFTRSPAS